MRKYLLIAAMLPLAAHAAPRHAALTAGDTRLCWQRSKAGWTLETTHDGTALPAAAAQHCVLYSATEPSAEPLAPADFGGEEGFPEPVYRYVLPSWREATTAVALNRAGQAVEFLPERLDRGADGSVTLTHADDAFSLTEVWRAEPSGDIRVDATLTAKRPGWFSIATPSLAAIDTAAIDFALIPGVLHGHEINPDFSHAYAYGWGIPALPVIYRDRSASTLTSILTTTAGTTLAVTAMPGTGAEPWGADTRQNGLWRLGLSAMNRGGEVTPTLYHPVLGQEGSRMEAGDERAFSFVYTLGRGGWWPVFDHAANDIYNFPAGLALRHNRRSLTDRLYGIHRYVVNDSTSRWHTVDCDGTPIGAQEYLGGVYLAQKDALKNADYGAMWMLGALTADTLLTAKRLPYALNFKVCQQDTSAGFTRGASRGQYYLSRGRRFVEEWGPYIEPIATTYYLLSDLGNIALFEPGNSEVRERLRLAADCLARWQRPDGSWEVAYEEETLAPAYTDLRDYRPTFYGLLVAYRVLGDPRYLAAARRGADWLIAEAVDRDRWLGVCGDTRFAPDFATAQAAQALLELHDATGDEKYLDAAIRAGRFYATSVYTAPVPSRVKRLVNGRGREDWEISYAGLSYEHGGIIGSTNLHGPILLASHAGLFARLYRLTGDRLFIDMARAAAIGRDAHVDDETAVASYYWNAMNRGAGPYPHHAWWQMGWITDYLVAELELRSGGEVSFPAGFITPKVGPHRSYGFTPGTVRGKTASLVMIPGAVTADNPDTEVLLARGDGEFYVMLLNDLGTPATVTLAVNADALGCPPATTSHTAELDPYGLEIITIPAN